MPDFLFHTPGDFNNQIAEIEIKTAALSRESLMDDLIKLTELRVIQIQKNRVIKRVKEFHVNLGRRRRL